MNLGEGGGAHIQPTTHYKGVAERIKPTSKGLLLKDFISITFWMTKSELENRIVFAGGTDGGYGGCYYKEGE